MVSAVESLPTKKRNRVAIDVQDECKALFIAGVPAEKIVADIGVKMGTLRSWISRGKWIATRERLTQPIAMAATQVVRDRQEALREKLGDRLLAAADRIGEPIDAADLRNQGQGYAAVLKTLAETHKTLYGGAEMNVLVFGVDSMNDRPGPQPVVLDVESSPSVTDTDS